MEYVEQCSLYNVRVAFNWLCSFCNLLAPRVQASRRAARIFRRHRKLCVTLFKIPRYRTVCNRALHHPLDFSTMTYFFFIFFLLETVIKIPKLTRRINNTASLASHRNYFFLIATYIRFFANEYIKAADKQLFLLLHWRTMYYDFTVQGHCLYFL